MCVFCACSFTYCACVCLRVTSFFFSFLKISSPSANHRVSFIPSDGPLDVSYMDEDTRGYHDEVDDAIDTVLRRHEQQQQQQQQQHGSSNHVYTDRLYDDEENGIVIDDDEEVDCDDFSPEKKISKRHSTTCTGGESSTGVSTGVEYTSQYHAAQHHQYSAADYQQHHLPHGTQHSISTFSNKAPTPSKNSYSKPQPQYDDSESNVNTYHYDRSAYEMGNERIDRDLLHSSRSLKGERQAALKMVYGKSPSGGGKKKLGRSNSPSSKEIPTPSNFLCHWQ